MLRSFLAAVFLLLNTLAAQAQETWWVQIAARPTLAEATDFARDASIRVSGIHGFYLGNGFYAIAVGPFDRQTAERARLRLLATAAIPGDSYVTSGSIYDRQFWPIGGGIAAPAPTQTPTETIVSALPDETPREARNSEGLLTRGERENLQRALQWAGFYNSAIDGAFGRGTRAAMEAWQIANAAEPTGILTTRQRAELIRQYNEVLDALDLQTVRDDEAGIAMSVPTAAVAFTEYQPPFVKFEARSGTPEARVLMISQSGDADTLRGLYEIMQSLDIVPVDGPRSVRADRFVIEGSDTRILSYTQAQLIDGAIKGFTLVWPADDRVTFDRLLPELQASFTALDGVLDPDIVPVSEDQSIDMIAGLAIRQPQLSRSGFYVSGDGAVLTTLDATLNCNRVTVNAEVEMSVVAQSPELQIAVLVPVEPQTPRDFARFADGPPRLRSRVAVAGFPYGGVLADPTLTFGTIADLRSLTGDVRQLRLDLTAQEGDAGGPVLDESGRVQGLLLERTSADGQILPENVSFAIKAAEISRFISELEIPAAIVTDAPAITPVGLTRQASDMGVLVSCW